MTVTVRAVAEALPELAPARWRALDGEPETSLAIARGVLLAQAAALKNPLWIAAGWEGERLRGLALAIVERHAPGRRVLVVALHYLIRRARCSGLWIADGEDRRTLAGELLRALVERCRGESDRLLVGFCPADDDALRSAVEDLRGRSLPAPPEYRLELPAGTTFEAYLEGLPKGARRDLRRALREPERVGAVLRAACPPGAEERAATWGLQRDTFARKGSALELGDANLFDALAARLPADAVCSITCALGDRVLGFCSAHRDGQVSQMLGTGHVADAGFNAYVAVEAASLRAEIDRGARTLLYGATADEHKRRLGCTADARVHLYVPMGAPA